MNKYDTMLKCNRESSATKIELAKKVILEMLEAQEKITIPALVKRTGLSRGFFYKNQIVRATLDRALEKQVGMTDSRKRILDMAMDTEIVALHQKIRELQCEKAALKEENEKLRRALDKKKASILRSL